MKRISVLGFCLVLALSACLPSVGGDDDTGVGDAVGTAYAQTQAVLDQAGTMVALTQAAQSGGNLVAPPPGNQQPVSQAITATANINLNCRYGPDAMYDVAEVVNQGTSAPVIGKNTTTSPAWYKLQLASGTECWAGSDNLTVSGSVAGLTEITTGFPTPRPLTYYWVGTWTTYQNWSTYNDPSHEIIMPVTFVATGPNTITATYAIGNCTAVTANLTISADGYSANGTNQYRGGTCNTNQELHFTMLTNRNQFRGKVNVPGQSSYDWYFAGSRNGLPAPDPRR